MAGWTQSGSFQGMAQPGQGLFTSNVVLNGVNGSAGDIIGIKIVPVGANYFSSAAPANTVLPYVVDNSDANLGVTAGDFSAIYGSGVYEFVGGVNYTLSSYTYSQSNGQTTEDVSGLTLGPISVTVTDCKGCTASWNDFVLFNYAYGCIDPLASNYDASC